MATCIGFYSPYIIYVFYEKINLGQKYNLMDITYEVHLPRDIPLWSFSLQAVERRFKVLKGVPIPSPWSSSVDKKDSITFSFAGLSSSALAKSCEYPFHKESYNRNKDFMLAQINMILSLYQTLKSFPW